MSDLISRKAVDSEICKLIEKLELKGLSMSYDMDDIIELQISIDDMPIAYDVDKAVEELKKRANLQDRVALSISDYAERYCHIKTADAYRQAILIVKGAVKDE